MLVTTYTSIVGISNENKYLVKMFPNKNWSLGGLKALIKKLTTQVLCGQ